LYTSAMDEEEDSSTLLVPGPSTDMSTVVTIAKLAPRRTCRAIDLWTCMLYLYLSLFLSRAIDLWA
jgi:hypothetical protein